MSKYLPINLFIRQALLYPLTFPFLPPVNKVEKDHKYAAGRLTGTLEAPPERGLPKTGQTVSYRDGDDGDFEKGYPITPPRFTDNEDGTITDNGSGLMWVKQPENIGGIWVSGGQPVKWNWNNAIDNCLALDYAGHDDWRLPNVKELMSIVDWGRNLPAIDPLFINCQAYYHWTSTSNHANAGATGWFVHFSTGVTSESGKSNTFNVRPVRGPVA